MEVKFFTCAVENLNGKVRLAKFFERQLHGCGVTQLGDAILDLLK